MKYSLAICLIVLLGYQSVQARNRDITSPVILSTEDARPFLDICKQVPLRLKESFALSDLLKEDRTYLQVIAMPSGNTLVILSGYSIAGLIVFDEGKNILQVLNWGQYMREQFPLYSLDKAYYRLKQQNKKWVLVVEYHAFTDRRGGDQYLWQFTYGPNSSGSSKRYRLQNVQPGATANGYRRR